MSYLGTSSPGPLAPLLVGLAGIYQKAYREAPESLIPVLFFFQPFSQNLKIHGW